MDIAIEGLNHCRLVNWVGLPMFEGMIPLFHPGRHKGSANELHL